MTPLGGVRVLDLTHLIAGPFCTKLLAELGTEVIKVERPGSGDGARRLGPFVKDQASQQGSIPFLYLNTGKKSVTLDLKQPEGAELFLRLVAEADAVVENFAPGVLDRLGVGYEAITERQPRVVLTSITNFGQTGPYRDTEATDLTLMAESGLLNAVGERDKPPTKIYGPFAQLCGGLHGAAATMTALFAAEVHGIGQHVDVSIQECLASQVNSHFVSLAYRDQDTHRHGNQMGLGGATVSVVQPAQDGFIQIFSRPWDVFFQAIGRPELKEDPRFEPSQRQYHIDEFEAAVVGYTIAHTKQELFLASQTQGLPWAPINAVPDLLDDPHLRERGFFVTIDHPTTGLVPYPGALFNMTGMQAIHGPSPLLGQHNGEVYGQVLGLDPDQMAALSARGVI